MNEDSHQTGFVRTVIAIVGIATITTLWVGMSLDPAGNLPSIGDGPGLTIDESFNVQQGVLLTAAIQNSGLFYFDPAIAREIFTMDVYLPDHPPLGRIWLGVFHNFVYAFSPPANAELMPVVIAYGRVSSAVAFGLTILLIGFTSLKWFGPTVGISSAVAYSLFPRIFSHAHLASLETVLNLTFALAVFTVGHFWAKNEPPKLKTAALTGIFLGLVLLTKIQGVFIPVVISAWALWNWRLKAIVPLMVWGGVGFVVFFIGWPWLWLDPFNHFMEYLGRTTDRVTLYNYYLGSRFEDRNTPWHYAPVMFLVTVPIGFQLMGFCGTGSRLKTIIADRRLQLIVANTAFPIMLFMLPVATYDGVRLFLVAFPFWAILVGIGTEQFLNWLKSRMKTTTAYTLVGVILAMQSVGIWTTHPNQLSYYNLAIGGLRGASALGFEKDYWSSSITKTVIESAIKDAKDTPNIYLGPTLHQFQINDWQTQWQGDAVKFFALEDLEKSSEAKNRYAIVFHRMANQPSDKLRTVLENSKIIHEHNREGVSLATVYRIGREPDNE